MLVLALKTARTRSALAFANGIADLILTFMVGVHTQRFSLHCVGRKRCNGSANLPYQPAKRRKQADSTRLRNPASQHEALFVLCSGSMPCLIQCTKKQVYYASACLIPSDPNSWGRREAESPSATLSRGAASTELRRTNNTLRVKGDVSQHCRSW